MKKTFALLTSVLAILLLTAMRADKPKKIIFFGDSITQIGVNPGGYISLMREDLKKQGKAADYELIGAGIGGNKVYDLYLRLEKDVLVHKPDVVVIFVGVNDVWHKQSFGTGTDPDKFRLFYTAIIKKIRASGARVVLCTPAVIGEKTDFSNQQDGDLNAYSSLIRTLAADYKCDLIDLRKLFLDYNLKNNPENKEQGILTNDRVHLNEAGNQLVAREMAGAVL
jgi:lysophospholipase L1-like esterase